MSSFIGIDIEKIYTIVYKEEQNEFHFINPERAFDGFVLITEGEGYVISDNNVKTQIRKGDMLLLRKGEKYETHFSCSCAYVTSGYDIKFDGGDFPINLPRVVRCTNGESENIKELCKIWQTRSWDAYTRCRIILLDFYVRIIQNQLSSNSEDNIAEKAKFFIHENFKRNFSGDEVSKYCNISTSYLRTKFISQTGLTINDYRNSLRYATAKEMLVSGIFSISEIASELGFCDVYHFSKFFKKLSGMSPTQYVKKLM